MKRVLGYVAAVAAVFCALVGVTACGYDEIHEFNATVIAPTCESDGYTLHECTVDGCGYSYSDNVVPAFGHSYDKYVCTRCLEIDPNAPYTSGFEYEPVYYKDGTSVKSYTIVGAGEAQTDSYIKIEGKHSSKPISGIADGVFEDRASVVAIALPSTVESIGERAFAGCTSLKGVQLPKELAELGEHAFKGCTALQTVTIPRSTDRIGFGAFEGCAGVRSMTLPMAVCRTAVDDGGLSQTEYMHFGYMFGAETYGQNAEFVPSTLASVKAVGTLPVIDNSFYGLTNIESLEIDGNVGRIGAGAFKSCTGMKKATVLTGVTKIGGEAFGGCEKLGALTLGAKVEEIGASAFYGCTALAEVTYYGTVAEFGAIRFVDEYSSPIAYSGQLYIGGQKVKYKKA